MSDIKTVKPVVLSYNQPEEADRLAEKLIGDGFDKFLVVDNGSDLKPPSKYANLRLPWNIRAIGQAKMALTYLMDYFPADYYWLINTNAELFETVNYREGIRQAFSELAGLEVGVLSSSLDSDRAPAWQRYIPANPKNGYTICMHVEPVSVLLSHRLLARCRQNGSAYFEPGFFRGWGCDYELCYEAASAGLWFVVAHRLGVKWTPNGGYRKNVGGESIETYFKNARQEMDQTLSRKHGRKWIRKFYKTYVRNVAAYRDRYEVNCDTNLKDADLSHPLVDWGRKVLAKGKRVLGRGEVQSQA